MSLFPIKTQTLTYFIIILNIFPSVSKQAGVEPKSISTENKAAERDSNNQTHSSAVFCGKIHFVLFYRKELRLPLFNWNLAGHAMPPGTAAGRRNTREATAKIDKRVVAERGRGGERGCQREPLLFCWFAQHQNRTEGESSNCKQLIPLDNIHSFSAGQPAPRSETANARRRLWLEINTLAFQPRLVSEGFWNARAKGVTFEQDAASVFILLKKKKIHLNSHQRLREKKKKKGFQLKAND